jgi:glycerol transport system ATP-binding protein
MQIGVRPEFITFASTGLPATVERVSDAGRSRIVYTRCAEHIVKVALPEHFDPPSGATHLQLDPAHTHLYADGWIVK